MEHMMEIKEKEEIQADKNTGDETKMDDENCAYCRKKATTEDALGLPACKGHEGSADGYMGRRSSDAWNNGI